MFKFDDFSGGYCGNKPIVSLAINEASDLSNIVLGAGKKGFYSRPGHRCMNNTAFSSGTGVVNGVGYSTAGIVAIRDGKFFTTSSFLIDGTASFSDSTGAYGGITDNDATRWTFFQMSGNLIGFGGSPGTPDAPIKWGLAGNVAALGGSSPSAYWGFAANNRAFAFRTAANPSTLYWSVLGDPTDWAGVGSGSTKIGTVADDTPLKAVVQLNNDSLLAFKSNSIYLVSLTAAPFSQRLLFNGVGAYAADSVVVVNGTAYFLTPDLRMKATDGNDIVDFPENALDILAIPSGIESYPGARFRATAFASFGGSGASFDWIVWSYISNNGDTNSYGVVWDLVNKCWLKIGNFHFTCFATNPDSGIVYAGGQSTGRVFSPVFAAAYPNIVVGGYSVFYDYEGSTTSRYTCYFNTGWMVGQRLENYMTIIRASLSGHSIGGGPVTVSVALKKDFATSAYTTLSFAVPARTTGTEILATQVTGGRGKAIKAEISFSPNPALSQQFIYVDRLELMGKEFGMSATKTAA